MAAAKHQTMTDARSRDLRHRHAVECSWAPDARLTDLSLNGCYVECRRVPRVGEQVHLTVTLDGQPTVLHGAVVHARRELGFAMRFEGNDAAVLARIRTFLAHSAVAPAPRTRLHTPPRR